MPEGAILTTRKTRANTEAGNKAPLPRIPTKMYEKKEKDFMTLLTRSSGHAALNTIDLPGRDDGGSVLRTQSPVLHLFTLSSD